MYDGCTCLAEISTQWPDDKPPQQVFDRSVLPSAPRSSSAPKVDQSRLPTKPPYTVYLGNLSFECAEDDIIRFFERRNINVRRCLAVYLTSCCTVFTWHGIPIHWVLGRPGNGTSGSVQYRLGRGRDVFPPFPLSLFILPPSPLHLSPSFPSPSSPSSLSPALPPSSSSSSSSLLLPPPPPPLLGDICPTPNGEWDQSNERIWVCRAGEYPGHHGSS